MSLAPLNEYLNSFRLRTKLRGNSFQEKMETFLSRIEKVALDCEASTDKSPYRKDYGGVHRNEFNNLKAIQLEFPFDDELKFRLKEYLSYLAGHLQEVHDDHSEFGRYGFDIVGTIDGLCYIVVELEEVLK